ncbi:dimethyl sulfoxide reductase anchor subunit [Xenorhabdus sp. PB61.4]|uniref:dimethyl sulfoxide reductase anchor subunit family protein n=1 Tax=Xenorhabdus sp. PB61.4 TaxID=2788940 RepID=UPI001E2E91B2|nr:DmsC/YnfH family molybdoenzyme membrane anchor subunit [Xenorhabdus sp. PB61.4]MCC8366593.1 dimethyl sulfoxide reductase anchor subunit [Xenorhabdus sp. PB61.4]
MSEWLLIAFTMIVQSSIGLVLMSALYTHFFNRKAGTGQKPEAVLVRRILVISSILAGIGLLSSLDIIGYPFSVYQLLQLHNIMQEWINTETALAAIYFITLSLYTLFVLLTKQSHAYIMAGISVIGLVDIHYMVNIYSNSDIITWTNVNTYFLFYGAVFTLGPALSLSLIGQSGRQFMREKIPTKLLMAALIIVFISVTTRLIEQPAYMGWLVEAVTDGETENIIFPHQPEINLKSAFGFRMITWCLYILAMTIWAYTLWKSRNKTLIRTSCPILSGTMIMLVAEIINQYIFFAMSNV